MSLWSRYKVRVLSVALPRSCSCSDLLSVLIQPVAFRLLHLHLMCVRLICVSSASFSCASVPSASHLPPSHLRLICVRLICIQPSHLRPSHLHPAEVCSIVLPPKFTVSIWATLASQLLTMCFPAPTIAPSSTLFVFAGHHCWLWCLFCQPGCSRLSKLQAASHLI
jgi:hypothetical protein